MSEKLKEMEELQKEIMREMEEIPEEWKSKVHYITEQNLIALRYGIGREFTEGYDFIYVYFKDKMSVKIFLNKHHYQCF